MSQELAKIDDKKIELNIELIKQTVAKGTTDAQLKLFLYTAQRTGLDPLTRQIHCVMRNNKKFDQNTKTWTEESVMTIQTGIDGYRTIAERSGSLAGIDDAIYDSEESENPKKATVTVYRIINGIRCPFTATARWLEYAQIYEKDEYIDNRKTGKKITVLGPMWKKMPYLMLAKCAEALALRKAFPNDLTGLYTNEEMAQADNVIQHVDVEVTPVSNTQSLPPNQPVQKTLTPQTTPPTTPPKKTCPNCKTEHTGQYPTCYNCYMMKRNGITPKAPEPTPNDDTPPFP
jgi:phage recombination protein Bet